MSDSSELYLRDVMEDDLSVFFEHQRDPVATAMAAFPAREPEAFQVHWAKILANDTVITRTVLVGDVVAGNVLCFEQSGMRLVGYWFGSEFWGKGVATRALAGFLTELTVRPLHAQVVRTNPGSIRVLEKCGFTLLEQDTGESGGEVPQELLYVLNDEENAQAGQRKQISTGDP